MMLKMFIFKSSAASEAWKLHQQVVLRKKQSLIGMNQGVVVGGWRGDLLTLHTS